MLFQCGRIAAARSRNQVHRGSQFLLDGTLALEGCVNLSKKISVHISEHLYEDVKRRVEKGRFKTVDEYVEFVLAEIIRDETPGQVYTHQEEEEIKERLRRLGYS